MSDYDLIAILGPTASGKTQFAAALASRLDTEIISADSRQIYKEMNLGTGKDLADYTVNGKQIPYHLIDIAEPGYKYNVFEYQRDFLKAYETVRLKGKLPIMCGGTGMYLESVLKGYRLLPVPENPELRARLNGKSLDELTEILKQYKTLHNTTDVDTAKRAIRAIEIEEYYAHTPVDERAFPQLNSLIVGIDIDRELRREKITRRLQQRLEEGMVEEVRDLIKKGIKPEDLIYYGLEYKYLTLYVIGELTYEQMFHDLEIAIHQFAKRADKNEPIETDLQSAFPHNELGEISQHIIQIYRRLRETKEALYIEREKLITHLQTSREGLGVFTKDKKEILVNNLFIQYSNLISDSNLETTEEIFAVCEFQKITDFIGKAQRSPLGKEEKRMSLTINKNGRIFIVECIIFQDLSFEISINDITQEEEQIRLKRQLTQNIAHELKTPVSNIQGYLETILSTQDLPQDKMQIFLERCYAQSNRLTRLLRDISVLTRMDEAANLIDMEKVDVSLLVGNIVNEVALELEEKDITVVNSLKPHILLRGNYSLLYSIFRNLMDNAIAYAGSHIHIHISCFREDENFYYFSFADTGVGVSPEHLNRLFERFYRVDKGRSRKLGGTGLGLAIVKNAVLIHGGTISAKNSQGGGLEFVFTLAKER